MLALAVLRHAREQPQVQAAALLQLRLDRLKGGG
jgi:hypothetical protein